jgi:hypothetical protein
MNSNFSLSIGLKILLISQCKDGQDDEDSSLNSMMVQEMDSIHLTTRIQQYKVQKTIEVNLSMGR